MNVREGLYKFINLPLVLAPMVGLSHVAFRLVLRKYMPKNAQIFWPTEMLNSRRLPNENFKITPETMKGENEVDLVPQILGNEEEPIAKSLRKLEAWGAIGVDINMGCPVQKALKHNYGVSLMGDSDYAARVVEMTVRNTKLPVSVKLRAGIESQPEQLLNFVKKLESAGVSWITLHPRLAHQKRRGSADWNLITKVRENLKIPVIGNGDIQVFDDIVDLLNSTSCDLVMAGRALTARPWLFWQVGEALGLEPPEGRSGFAPRTPVEEALEYARSFNDLINECENYFKPDYAIRKIKFFSRTSSPWLEYGHEFNSKISGCNSTQAMRCVIEDFFSKPQKMMQKTELRI